MNFKESEVLIVQRREASWIVAAVLVFVVAAFVIGFVVGQRAAARDFMRRAAAERELIDAQKPPITPNSLSPRAGQEG